ncbi:PDZ domain-containing protein [Paenibacillus sp. SYP-B4298]|uniref:PDZ domain-containing protein n=1 Tax=Paenibacillus sp. SYP-B4298 TaxID=2996034 RepID=UPI0022DDA25A|nr:PDZ domain-containing protein [Paenibacillus sp. SYP-B4298]
MLRNGSESMELTLEILRQAGEAVVSLLLQPFYYIAVLLVVLHFVRQTRTERKLFHVRMRPWPLLLLKLLVMGMAAGIGVSALSFGIGAAIQIETVYWLWGVTAILVLFRIRYLCFAYSAGVLGVLHWAASWVNEDVLGAWAAPYVASLQRLDIPGLLLLIAMLHLAEAWFMRSQGERLASPIVMKSKRGKLIGGYQLQGYWPIPLLLLVPAGAAGFALPWAPLLGGEGPGGGWMLLGLPMIVGYSELTRSLLPRQRARQTAKTLLWYSLALGAIAALAIWWPPLTLVAAIGALLLHEAIGWISAAGEARRSPFYVHNGQGLCVLAVVPGSPAAELGIVPGELVHKVNGRKTLTPEDFHEALHIHSAFCKLEIINYDGHVRFEQRARFDGDHHHLGIVLAPDDSSEYYTAAKQGTLLELFGRGPAASSRRMTPPM